MKTKTKKILLFIIIFSALAILAGAGLTFAYFQASINSKPNAIDAHAAVFEIGLEEDSSLIKSNIIPSAEEYVNTATIRRRDTNKNFLKPTKNPQTGEIEKAGTACIDDNENEICSIYTFQIINKSKTDTPLYVTLNPSINTFENLYLKVINKEGTEIIPATHIVDSRYQIDAEGHYLKDDDKNWLKKDNFDTLKQDPIVLTGINSLKGSTDLENPTKDEYSIIMWINENDHNQTKSDGGKMFASTLNITSSYDGVGGVTGVFSAFGTENP